MTYEMKNYFEKQAKAGKEGFAIAWSLLELAESQNCVAKAVQKLGNAGASTEFGAIEALSMEVSKISSSLDGLASAVSELGNDIG